MAYAIVRTDKMTGTDVRSELVSVRYQASSKNAAIENGNVALLGALEADSREVYVATAPAANSPIAQIVLIATPEVMYDHYDLTLFRNEEGTIARGYRLHEHDIFSVTAEALAAASPAVGQFVELAAGTKLKNVASFTSGSTKVGKIIEKQVIGSQTFYAIEVGKID